MADLDRLLRSAQINSLLLQGGGTVVTAVVLFLQNERAVSNGREAHGLQLGVPLLPWLLELVTLVLIFRRHSDFGRGWLKTFL